MQGADLHGGADPAQECAAEFTALSDAEPSPSDLKQQFIVRLLPEQKIHIVSMNRVERFAEDLRRQLQ